MARISSTYQDFMLMALPPSKPRWHRFLPRLFDRRRGRFYPTGFKQLRDGRVEVTFYLPPPVLRQMGQAISSGKRIRLFVPR